jgi:hypothetical protein
MNFAPQPEDGIILRGAVQMETALMALRAAGLNPELQDYLGAQTELMKADAKRMEEADIPFSGTWFMLHSEEARQAKRDILESLRRAEADQTSQELAYAASTLLDILTEE